jgi:glycosyltransferase involved in cell wall biosynthesis
MPPPSQDELVSVVMPVHNALPHLDAAVRSILQQSHRNIEFVIYDDASTDGSVERLRAWATRDSRIRLFEGDRNVGPALSSNLVVQRATARIIARMDADDVSNPDRIARELEVLSKRPDVGLVGTLCEIIDAEGDRLRGPEVWRLTRNSAFAPFPHGSILYRREIFDRLGGYRHQCEFWEDQDLVLRMASATSIAVIPEPLYQHRQSVASTRVSSDQARVEHAIDLMYRAMGRLGEKRDYEDLLEGTQGHRKVDPRVFISLGSLILWAGGQPRLLQRLLRRGELRANLKTLSAIVWAAWAEIGPASLRTFLSVLVKARNLGASKSSCRVPVVWSPPHQLTQLASSSRRIPSPSTSIPRRRGRK